MTKEDVIEILERFVIGAKPCSQREIVDACASAYRMLKEQPSLPSDLDEAADTFNREDAARMWDYEGKTEGEIVDAAFKAGAEWMAGQGETVEGVFRAGDPGYIRVQKILAIAFMNLLDRERPEGKMCLSNMECADIEDAFKVGDWDKLFRYAEKYIKK